MHRPTASTLPAETGLLMLCQLGSTGPIIRCSSCGKRITKASMGAVVWDESLDNDEAAEPIFLCKGEDASFTTCLNSLNYKRLPWMQLDGFLGHLLFNLGVRSVAEYKRIAENSAHEAAV